MGMNGKTSESTISSSLRGCLVPAMIVFSVLRARKNKKLPKALRYHPSKTKDSVSNRPYHVRAMSDVIRVRCVM